MTRPLYDQNDPLNFPVSIAPMLDHTDRHYRYFMRKITKKTVLYTEMITTGAILYGDAQKMLEFDPSEHPLVLQLGGSDPQDLAKCAQIARDFGYDAINLNVGCPSDRVQKGQFGAALMDRPQLVADCLAALKESSGLPVSIKHRIGIDNKDSYGFLKSFVQSVSQSGCRHFIIHSRIALLKGLSPKQNRSVPPIRYEDVYRVKEDFPDHYIEINGEIKTIPNILDHKKHLDAVMIGRQAYENPYLFSTVDALFSGEKVPAKSRMEIVQMMVPYIDHVRQQSGRAHPVVRHMLNLMKGLAGSKRWRGVLSQSSRWTGTTQSLIDEALRSIKEKDLESGVGDASL